jgi:hypothetical protein
MQGPHPDDGAAQIAAVAAAQQAAQQAAHQAAAVQAVQHAQAQAAHAAQAQAHAVQAAAHAAAQAANAARNAASQSFVRALKLDKYGGDRDPTHWLYTMSQFFDATGMEAGGRVPHAALLLTGTAQTWWRAHETAVRQNTAQPIRTWDAFCTAMAEQFRVLKPGGVALAFVPDLEGILATDDRVYTSIMGDDISGLDMIYGKASYVASNRYMAHHCGFTSKTLAGVFTDAGFERVTTQRMGATVFCGGIKPKN